ncbi:uncharacterized protein PHALS_07180 [Plasmopara halstedii]|uniref:Uncharacterized protein n=1 Tax=Plasmopara halstedii TaxID=4781 RepID=A0A0P1B3S5_PLAHL|nr:uncharacterized protein PHALS_07180 [Plasmopara halstedii]CEG49416.1 hypothetical protein PHALS_07180 [Plasmopara halstedii]|eukprot:XP_024585785.1 hypothetical protein PHALS_07180 [Plasmopara halstedii]
MPIITHRIESFPVCIVEAYYADSFDHLVATVISVTWIRLHYSISYCLVATSSQVLFALPLSLTPSCLLCGSSFAKGTPSFFNPDFIGASSFALDTVLTNI